MTDTAGRNPPVMPPGRELVPVKWLVHVPPGEDFGDRWFADHSLDTALTFAFSDGCPDEDGVSVYVEIGDKQSALPRTGALYVGDVTREQYRALRKAVTSAQQGAEASRE